MLPVREKIKARERRSIYLAIDRKDAEVLAAKLEAGRCKARARLLRALLKENPLDYTNASKELGIRAGVLDPLLEQGVIRVVSEEVCRMTVAGNAIPKEEAKILTPVQKDAVAQIKKEWQSERPRPVLLYGVTGSGKTQVYMELIEQVIEEGRQAIVLIPEIALTYQTVRRFCGRFGDKVSVLNSRLSQGERYDQFKRAKRGKYRLW